MRIEQHEEEIKDETPKGRNIIEIKHDQKVNYQDDSKQLPVAVRAMSHSFYIV